MNSDNLRLIQGGRKADKTDIVVYDAESGLNGVLLVTWRARVGPQRNIDDVDRMCEAWYFAKAR